mmetsp:Transcript_22811/g.58054  ORF Transcript_22811/g.58054 Transcript_22811/m.58054 type:complete len:90 (-) Transcript_22811:83-352(-)
MTTQGSDSKSKLVEQQPAAGPAVPPGSRSSVPGQDCLGCRMVGMAFGLGGGGYIMSQLLQVPPPKGAHKVATIVTACTMFAFGMYRALG